MAPGTRCTRRLRAVLARRWRLLPGVAAAAFLLTGCATNHSALNPKGPKSSIVAMSWWILFAVAAFVCLVVISLTLFAAFRRRGADTRVDSGDRTRFVVTLGVAIPSLILAGTFALSVTTLAANNGPPSAARYTIDVIGHRWWWEFRYEGTTAVTANEMHIPAGTPVRLRLWTADVIHSFWAPSLMPKLDLLPSRVNATWIDADDVGTYRGQCAEYCGAQHANMAFTVVAQPMSQFKSWLSTQSKSAAPPTGPLRSLGYAVFETSDCATCHTIRGTSANGHVGPDLTHVGGRSRLAAETIPNTQGNMAGWISNSQTIKPGNLMPPQVQLTPRQLHALVAYLQGLR